MDDRFDIVIIGAGIVGAAIAQKSASLGRSVLILEKHDRIAEGVTSRNSGVIHSSLYYPPQSLKAKLCLRGQQLLYEWAQKKKVPHFKCGKLVVATNEGEEIELENIFKNAIESGARSLSWWGKEKINAAFLRGRRAMFAADTGIIDPYLFTKSLIDDSENNGAMVLKNAEVLNIRRENDGYFLETTRGSIKAEKVYNAAGLDSDRVAALVGVGNYKIYPCRGDYFRLRSTIKYQHLVYPVKAKVDTGLGIHLTLDLNGGYRLGPDTEFVESRNQFESREYKLEKFRTAAEKLLGPIDSSQLSYDQCGIRPKLRSPYENEEKDFVVREDLPGFINLVGIESPGLTSALAIAEKCLISG